MQKNNDFFLNGKFKKVYFILTCTLSIVAILFTSILYLINGKIDSDFLFYYYNIFLVIFVICGMIIDEKIRKYPGLIVTIGTSVYCLSYVTLCSMKSNINILIIICFTLFILVSYLIYKYIYPKIIVVKNRNKIFNTIYLIVVLSITFLVGSILWL